MEYLLPKDYFEILYTTVENNLSPALIRDFLFNKWEINKKDNPDFLKHLGEKILYIGNEIDGKIKYDFKSLNINKEHCLKLIEGYKLLMEKIDEIKDSPEDRSENKRIKIKWNGDLKEFAELIDSLEKNNWITINDGELSQSVKAICQIFDFSQTKKTKDSNTESSLIQYLKQSERESKIYTKRYSKKFNSISSNNKEK